MLPFRKENLAKPSPVRQWERKNVADHSRMFRTQGFYSDARESSKEKEQVFFPSLAGEGKLAAGLG